MIHLRDRPHCQPGTVVWRNKPLRFADGLALYGQLHDIFVKRAYDFMSETRAPRLIDCGAHVGVTVMRWRELYPSAQITAIEADPAIAGLLRQNLAARDDSATRVITAAVWTSNTTTDFHATGSDNGCVRPGGVLKIPALDLATFCREPVDLLKLDIEGSEEAVLTHLADTGALRAVRRLVCEWHQWTPAAPRMHLILDRLVQAGFIYRLSESHCLGDQAAPGFAQLAWPGNQLMLYAWQQNPALPPP